MGPTLIGRIRRIRFQSRMDHRNRKDIIKTGATTMRVDLHFLKLSEVDQDFWEHVTTSVELIPETGVDAPN